MGIGYKLEYIGDGRRQYGWGILRMRNGMSPVRIHAFFFGKGRYESPPWSIFDELNGLWKNE